MEREREERREKRGEERRERTLKNGCFGHAR
jgi:hypothetical protein